MNCAQIIKKGNICIRSLRIAFLIAILLLASCSKSSSKKGDLGDGGLSESDLDAQREGRFGSGSIPTAEGEGLFKDIRFAYDSYQVSEAGQREIEANAEVLRQNPNWNVTIEGHCDERGTNEYNMALGEQRAKSVRDVLVSLGISPSKVSTVSYGEEIPLDPEHSESAFARNRRAHFSASSGAR